MSERVGSVGQTNERKDQLSYVDGDGEDGGALLIVVKTQEAFSADGR